MKPKNQNRLLTVGILGPPDVGKTSLCRALVGLKVQVDRAWGAPEDLSKTFQISQGQTTKQIQLSLLDVIGQQEYRSTALSHVADADVILILIDVTKKRPWKADTKEFLKLVSEQDGTQRRKVKRPTYLVCTKLDKHEPEHAKALRSLHNIARKGNRTVFEISALEGTGMEDLKSTLFELEQQLFDRRNASCCIIS